MSRLYQNRRGSPLIAPSVDSLQRLENTALIVPEENVWAVTFEFGPSADTGGGTEFLIRYGSSSANNPAIGFRHRGVNNDYVVIVNTSTGTASINIGDLPNGNRYRICVCASGAGASQAAAAATFAALHPGANGTDQVGVVRVYKIYDAALQAESRSPTAVDTYSNSAFLLGTLDALTGVNVQAQTGYTDYRIAELAVLTGGTLSAAECDEYGQFTLNTSKVAAWNHYWPLSFYASAAISLSPTGEEAWHLADQGTGDGTSVRNLARNAATTMPVWSTTRLTQAIAAAEDPVLDEDFTVSTTRNLGIVRAAIETRGAIVALSGDSIQRPDGDARYGGYIIEHLIAAGYVCGSMTCYLRLGGTPVSVTVPSMTNVTTAWYCNVALGGGSYNNNPGGASVRYGAPIGGIFEAVSGGSVTLGTDDEIIAFDITNAVHTVEWFDEDDDLWIRVPVYLTDDGNQFTGIIEVVTPEETVEIDLGATDAWRQFPQDAAWSAVGSAAADSVDLYPNAGFVDVHVGTGATDYAVSIRIKTPAEFTSGLKVLVANPTVYKKVGGERLYGPGVFHPMSYCDSSANLSDFYTDAASTINGTKLHSSEQWGRWVGLCHDEPSAAYLQVQVIQTENLAEATVEGHIATLVARYDTILGDMNWTGGDAVHLLVSHITNNIFLDTVAHDRGQCIAWRNAFRDAADADPTRVAHWSIFDFTEGFFLATSAVADDNYTEMAIGEAAEVAADAVLLAAIGGDAEALETEGVLHPTKASFCDAVMEAMVAAIEAASLGGGSVSGTAGNSGISVAVWVGV